MTQEFDSRFIAARRKYIAAQFQNLNNMQQEAVLTTEGPLLLLAGAGSGKTTVLIHRIANLLRFGSGSDSTFVPDYISEDDVEFLENLPETMSDYDYHRADYLCGVDVPNPWNIIAITFTNKAANELKERLEHMLGEAGMGIWAMTFHSACCRILRRDIERLGYTSKFTIYDRSDSEKVIKDILYNLGIPETTLSVKDAIYAFSKFAADRVSSETLVEMADNCNDIKRQYAARVYARYLERLKYNNAVDFDNIILLTIKLLKEHEDVRKYYQNQFKYVMVDEYQDTNQMQYELTKLLAGGKENICVVGDDDQSIYRFRGADITNILDFEKHYKAARVIRLEQNYRSTQRILNAANSIISHNIHRKGKRLWTTNDIGKLIEVYEAFDEKSEAQFVINQIKACMSHSQYSDYVILYRNNAQSNILEQTLKLSKIPYRIVGGFRFYEKAEIKDMLAYLCVINNRTDDLRLRRIINNPPRRLGAKTLEEALRLAEVEKKTLYEIIRDPYSYGPLQKNADKFLEFTKLIDELAVAATEFPLPDFYDILLERSGYVSMLQKKENEDNKIRLENVKELKSSIVSYCENTLTPSLAGFLEEIALYTDIEEYGINDDAVTLMTMHASKGMEFPHVFLVGFEEGLFPGGRAIGDIDEMEEERRLCYVAITRAKETLTISHARQRMLYGRTNAAIGSRFLKELPEDDIVRKGTSEPRRQTYQDGWSQYTYTPRPVKTELSYKPAASSPVVDFNKGDMVQHTAFGQGMVLSVIKMGGDALLEIAFDQIGTKKLMAKTASVHMKKL